MVFRSIFEFHFVENLLLRVRTQVYRIRLSELNLVLSTFLSYIYFTEDSEVIPGLRTSQADT